MNSTPTVTRQRTGHCLCGAIRYSFDADPEAVVLCHCGECQRHTGSAFSVNVLIPRAALEITGTPATYQTTGTENGHLRDRLFCPHCGTPIFTILHERPTLIIVKAGTLDDPSGLNPVAEVWCRRSQDWLDPHPTRPRYDGDAK
jgi:hypothetical protein